MNEQWHRILTWFASKAPGARFSAEPPASEEEVASTESLLDVRLPPDVRESYLLHNGGKSGAFYRNYRFMPLDEIRDSWRMLTGSSLEEYPASPEGPVKAVSWNRRWIPIMDTGAGDHLCVDLDPEPGGSVGQVIEWSHEEGPSSVLAPSFRQWLSQYADDLEAGRYRFDPMSGNIARTGAHPRQDGAD
jgi:cell wall assembly regulator SMI1